MRAIHHWHVTCCTVVRPGSRVSPTKGSDDADRNRLQSEARATHHPRCGATLAAAGDETADPIQRDEEPPSNEAARVRSPRERSAVMDQPDGALLVQEVSADDEFAEWDTAETIDAVAEALGAYWDGHPARGDGRVSGAASGGTPGHRVQHGRRIWAARIARLTCRRSASSSACRTTGSDPLTLVALPRQVADQGDPVALWGRHTVLRRGRIRRGGERHWPSLRYPLFVKPIHEGSSKGITERNLCQTPADLAAQVDFLLETYTQPVLIEEYLPGAEFTCAVLGNGQRARVLPIVGMNFDACRMVRCRSTGSRRSGCGTGPMHRCGSSIVPPRSPTHCARTIESTTLRAYQALGCRDWSRVDLRLDAAGMPNVIRGESLARHPSQPRGQLLLSKSGTRGRDQLRSAHPDVPDTRRRAAGQSDCGGCAHEGRRVVRRRVGARQVARPADPRGGRVGGDGNGQRRARGDPDSGEP